MSFNFGRDHVFRLRACGGAKQQQNFNQHGVRSASGVLILSRDNGPLGELIAKLVYRFTHVDHGRTDTRKLLIDPVGLVEAVPYIGSDPDPALFGLGGINKRLTLPQPDLDGI